MGLGEPRLVRNGVADDHLATLDSMIRGASEISVAVAFLKAKGLGKIVRRLSERLQAGATVEMFVGSDFCLTEPDALKTLLDLSCEHEALKVFLAKSRTSSTFHPKLYLASSGKKARVLMGSANLTGGALTSNEEMSLAWWLPEGDPLLRDLREVFSGYRSDDRFDELDAIVLELYRRRFTVARDARRRVEKEIAAADVAAFDVDKLTSFHKEFLADPDEVAALEERRRNMKQALAVQRMIARMNAAPRMSKADRATFTSLFRDLVTSGGGHRHLWHSGDIHRRGQAALAQPRETVALFSLGEKAAKLPPVEGYARMRGPAGGIAGVGVNMVSEILCTFAPDRYAVFNGNTAAALRALGADPPRTATLFSPEAYARVCGIVDAVRRRTGGADLSDADAFLNWVYKTKVKTAGGN